MRAALTLLFLVVFTISAFSKVSPSTDSFLTHEMDETASDYKNKRGKFAKKPAMLGSFVLPHDNDMNRDDPPDFGSYELPKKTSYASASNSEPHLTEAEAIEWLRNTNKEYMGHSKPQRLHSTLMKKGEHFKIITPTVASPKQKTEFVESQESDSSEEKAENQEENLIDLDKKKKKKTSRRLRRLR